MNEISWAITGLVIGLGLMVFGGELLVRAASRLAAAMRIPPLVIGLTVVAFGTSSPELVVSLQSAIAGNSELALGNVIGSNIFNVLFILGVTALIVPLLVSSVLIRRDVPLMIGATVGVFILGWDNRIGRTDGIILFSGLLIYIWLCITQSRQENETVQTEFSNLSPSPDLDRFGWVIQICFVLGGLVLLVWGSTWFVGGAVVVATNLGLSQLIIGLTIVAAGTSLPEVVTSIIAAIRGEREIAVGNIVGSNLFNILGVLGLSSICAPSGIEVSAAALSFDIPLMIVIAIACLPIFFTGNEIARWEGGVFVFYYVAYTVYLFLSSTGNEFSRTFGNLILFVIPLAGVTLFVISCRPGRLRPDKSRPIETANEANRETELD